MRSALPLAFYGAKLLNLFQSGVYFPEKTQQRCGVLRDCDASNQWGQFV
jgi:hypothetical protein